MDDNLSSDDSDMDDNFNEASFMSRMSSTTTENEEDDQGLDRIRMLMLNYYGNEGFNDEEEDEETKMNDIDGENFDVDVQDVHIHKRTGSLSVVGFCLETLLRCART